MTQQLSWVLDESDAVTEDKGVTTLLPPSATRREIRIEWFNFISIFFMHLGSLYGAYLFVTRAMWTTIVFSVLLYVTTALSITAGAHRLWSHRAYKARLPLRVLLIIFTSSACQGHTYGWTRDHRMHHKYADTDADPYNATRGFFFAQLGWLLIRKHPAIKAKGHTVPVDDLNEDQVLQYQKKYYWIWMMPFFCYILPTYIPTLWGESIWTAHFVCAHFRHACLYYVTGLVNSAAHMWGTRPYDKHIKPVEIEILSFFSFGEGFHNFHHTFPWDYKTRELGGYWLNLSKLFIDAMAKIGWAYDLKSVSMDIVEKRVKRTGDGSHYLWGNKNKH